MGPAIRHHWTPPLAPNSPPATSCKAATSVQKTEDTQCESYRTRNMGGIGSINRTGHPRDEGPASPLFKAAITEASPTSSPISRPPHHTRAILLRRAEPGCTFCASVHSFLEKSSRERQDFLVPEKQYHKFNLHFPYHYKKPMRGSGDDHTIQVTKTLETREQNHEKWQARAHRAQPRLDIA